MFVKMNDKKILLLCPVRDRAWVLPYYLKHVYNLDYPKHLISILWLINQSKDDSEKILKEFKNKYEHEYNKIEIEHYKSNKIIPEYNRERNDKVYVYSDGRKEVVKDKSTDAVYTHLAEIRNYLLSKIGDHDYIFSCDSDILVRSDCLSKLVSHGKDVISAIIFNGYKAAGKENAWRYPNVLRVLSDGKIEHVANSYIRKSPEATESKLLRINITGAVYLISNEVAKKVKYAYHVKGEDTPFCLDAESKGFEIWCDTGIFNRHIMDKEMLKEYLEE